MNKECRLAIQVSPKSAKNEISGWKDSELKVRLRAIPEKGKANCVLIEFLAEVLDLPKSAITLLRGETSRHKLVLIRGINHAQLEIKINTVINHPM